MKLSSQDYKRESMNEPNDDDILDKEELEQLVKENLEGDDCQTAAFWAEKLLAMDQGKTLNNRLPRIAHYLSVLTAGRAWQTIITLIERHGLFMKHLAFAYFNVNALFYREMFSHIIVLPIGHLCRWDDVPFISPDSASYICAESDKIRDPIIKEQLDKLVKRRKYDSRLLFLLAKTYLMVQNRPAAASCLKHCLTSYPYCSEALHLALDSRLMKANELQEIVSSSKAINNSSGSRIINYLLDIYDLCRESNTFTTDSFKLSQLLASDLSYQSATAFRVYSQGSIQQAYKITATIMHEFGYYSKCFLIHIGCLVHLNKVSELYQLGHSMVKLQPEREITWYTVGCYYYATGQYSTAKKFLNKCTLMNSGFGEGWLVYGHTLFFVEEHEQAMNCYLRASRILEDHFEPLLYIAVEYCFANNYKLATDFLHDAELIAGANAIVLHEQGTVAFMEHNFRRAEEILMEALRLITRQTMIEPLEHLLSVEIGDFWEPLFNNLGHTLRKLGKYEQAILVHRKALLLGATKAESWACIGLCYGSLVSECGEDGGENSSSSISASIDSAMEALNKALALRPGDDLVKMALEKLLIFASKRASLKQFPLDITPDENLDTMLEERFKQQAQKRNRDAPSKGLDRLDTTSDGKIIPISSSPMTSQQATAATHIPFIF